MNKNEVDFRDILDSLRSRWKIVAFVTIIGIILSLFFTFCIITPMYTASTKLFIGKEHSENVSKDDKENYDNNDIQMYQRILQTYADIIQTKTLASKVIDKENVNLKNSDVLKNLTVIPKEDTQIIEITYVDKDPYLAKEMLEAISDEFINYSTNLIPNANIQIVERVFLPDKASTPNVFANIAIGFMIGLLTGIVAALILEYMSNTFEDKKKLESEIGIAVIGDIPSFDMNK